MTAVLLHQILQSRPPATDQEAVHEWCDQVIREHGPDQLLIALLAA